MIARLLLRPVTYVRYVEFSCTRLYQAVLASVTLFPLGVHRRWFYKESCEPSERPRRSNVPSTKVHGGRYVRCRSRRSRVLPKCPPFHQCVLEGGMLPLLRAVSAAVSCPRSPQGTFHRDSCCPGIRFIMYAWRSIASSPIYSDRVDRQLRSLLSLHVHGCNSESGVRNMDESCHCMLALIDIRPASLGDRGSRVRSGLDTFTRGEHFCPWFGPSRSGSGHGTCCEA